MGACVKSEDVTALARGLQAILPDLVQIAGDRITVDTNAERIAVAIRSQLEEFRPNRRTR